MPLSLSYFFKPPVVRSFAGACLLLWLCLQSCVAAPTDEATQPLKAEIIAAVKFAYGLEKAYWRKPRALRGRDAIYAHYRRGFSPDIAERMTKFTLQRSGDYATWVPRTVQVVSSDRRAALAWFRVPQRLVDDDTWGYEPYMVVKLRPEDGRWIIYWARDVPTPPSGRS